MKLRLAHYRNRFSMFRTYYALGAGLVKTDGLDITVVEVPDPPSRELEECLIRGDVDLATHQGRHAIHQYLLKNTYGVDSARLQWTAGAQETLLDILRRGDADAVVL